MRFFFRPLLIAGFASLLGACGGGSSNGTTTNSTVAVPPASILPGTSITMATASSVLVPSGSTVSSPNGNVITVGGSSNTIFAQPGSIVNVPSSATGAANNLVSTGQATTGGISIAPPKITALAGSATTNLYPIDGTGASAVLGGGGHLALDSAGNIAMSDRGAWRKVTLGGDVTTLNPIDFPLDWEGIAIDAAGNRYGSGLTSQWQLASSSPSGGVSIGEVTASGELKTISLNWETATIGSSSVGQGGLSLDSHGNLYLADGPHNRIVKFTPSGEVSVFAGDGTSGQTDAVGTAASFVSPTDLTIDRADNIYVRSANAIRKIASDGAVTTLVKVAISDGNAIAADQSGTVYTTGAGMIVRVDHSGNVTYFQVPEIQDPITALVADSNGNLFAATKGRGAQIFKISF